MLTTSPIPSQYATVRKVLLHELVHNMISSHDVAFNTLNSELNKEVYDFELEAGISTAGGGGDTSAWQPSGEDSGELRTSHRLDEPTVVTRVALESSREDEFEARRERQRVAAEMRQRRSDESAREE